MSNDRFHYNHQHSQSADDNVVTVAAAYADIGVERLEGAGGTANADPGDADGVGLAVGTQMRAYEKPRRRRKDNPDKPLCQTDGCRAYPMKGIDHCTGHARAMGLIENWSTASKEAS